MAGSWTGPTLVKGLNDNCAVSMVGYSYEFTADAADGSIPDLVLTDVAGFCFGVDTTFDGTTPPNELTTVCKKPSGNTVWSPTKQIAPGYMVPDAPIAIAGGIKFSFAQTAAATNSAKCVVIVEIGS